jgi:hypothetical protein
MSVTSTGNDDSYSNDDNDDDEYIDNNYDHTTATSASRYALRSKKSTTSSSSTIKQQGRKNNISSSTNKRRGKQTTTATSRCHPHHQQLLVSNISQTKPTDAKHHQPITTEEATSTNVQIFEILIWNNDRSISDVIAEIKLASQCSIPRPKGTLELGHQFYKVTQINDMQHWRQSTVTDINDNENISISIDGVHDHQIWGSGGSSPPPFLFSRETQNSEEQKKRGKRDGPRTDNTTISVALFFQRLLKSPSSHINVDVTP